MNSLLSKLTPPIYEFNLVTKQLTRKPIGVKGCLINDRQLLKRYNGLFNVVVSKKGCI